MLKLIRSLFSDKRGLALVEFAVVAPFLLALSLGMVEFSRYAIILQKVERSSYALSDIIAQYKPIPKDSAVASPNELDYTALTNDVLTQFKRTMSPYVSDSDRIAVITSMTRINTKLDNSSLKINWQVAGGGSLGMPTASNSLTDNNNTAANTTNGPHADDSNNNEHNTGVTTTNDPHDDDDKVMSSTTGLEVTNMASKKTVNGAAAGTNPTFPTYPNPNLMGGVLEDMAVGENMIIVETFYNYQPILSDVLERFGAVSLAQRTMHSEVYSRPRYGALDNLQRPEVTNDNCPLTPIVNPQPICSTVNYVKTCTTCSDLKICSTCTSKWDGTQIDKKCVVTSSTKTNCTTTTEDLPKPPPPPTSRELCRLEPIEPTNSCSTANNFTTCKSTETCTSCKTNKICDTCTTPFGGVETCVYKNTTLTDCTSVVKDPVAIVGCVPPPIPPVVTTECSDTRLTESNVSCITRTTDLKKCIDETTCKSCKTRRDCSTCTTPSGGVKSCVPSSTTFIECEDTKPIFSDTPNCTVVGPRKPPIGGGSKDR